MVIALLRSGVLSDSAWNEDSNSEDISDATHNEVVFNNVMFPVCIAFALALLVWITYRPPTPKAPWQMRALFWGCLFWADAFIVGQYFSYGLNYVAQYRVSCLNSQWTSFLYGLSKMMLYWFYLARVYFIFPPDSVSLGYSCNTLIGVSVWIFLSASMALAYYMWYTLAKVQCRNGWRATFVVAVVDLFNSATVLLMFLRKLQQLSQLYDNSVRQSFTTSGRERTVKLMFKLTVLFGSAVLCAWLCILLLTRLSGSVAFAVDACIQTYILNLSFRANADVYDTLCALCVSMCEKPLLVASRKRWEKGLREENLYSSLVSSVHCEEATVSKTFE